MKRRSTEHGSGHFERGRTQFLLALLLLALVVVAVLAFAILRGPDREARRPTEPGPGASPGTSLRTVFTEPRRPSGAPGVPGSGVGTPGTAGAEYIPGRLVVKFVDGIDPTAARRLLGRIDADLEATVAPLDVRVVDVPPKETRTALQTVASSPAVEYVERDVAVHSFGTVPNDTLWGEQWGPTLVDGPGAWDLTRGSPSVVVAVVDTGVDPTHPDLQGSLVAGYDFVNGDGNADDDDGHGTAAAGVIAARTNNGTGLAGVCWTCSLMPVKVLDASGTGSMADVAAGIVWAVDHGARVISMSLGGPQSTQTLSDAVAYATARGAILVAAAGNDGTSDASYPAALEGVIGVSGTTVADALYSWSNFGPWVQVAAPGCNVATYLHGEYVNFCGTSSATPIVAGIAALAISARPDATRLQVEQALLSSVAPLGGAVRHGRVNAQRTLEALGTPVPEAAPAPAQPAPKRRAKLRGRLAAGAPLELAERVLPAGRMTATLVAPGARGLVLELVDARNDLVARVSGRSPLRLSRSIAGGRYRFLVRGRGRTSFTLRVVSAS